MSKPKSIPVPEAEQAERHHVRDNGTPQQEPLSGSKKTKMQNHVSHRNPEG